MKTLVLTDFSDVSKRALEYTLDLLVTKNSEDVTLAHVVSNAQETSQAMANFDTFMEGIPNPHGVVVKKEVLQGDLYDASGAFCNKHGYEMMVFGTHGARGLQKILGSHAVKLVQHTSAPVIIVQDEIHRDPDGIKQIALPLTLAAEDKKMLAHVCRVAKIMGAMVEIIYHEKTDEYLARTMMLNLKFTKNYLTREGVSFNINMVPSGENFDKQVVDISKEKSCDLIATVNHHEDGFMNLFGWSFDQNMIENIAHIPVFTVDAKPAGEVTDIFSTTV